MRRVVVVAACVIGLLWVAPVTGAAPAPVQAVAGAATGGAVTGGRNVLADFNADTDADLAVGVPGEDSRSGVVNVIYGRGPGCRQPPSPTSSGARGAPTWKAPPTAGTGSASWWPPPRRQGRPAGSPA